MNFSGTCNNKTNEYFLNIDVPNQVYYLNNVSIEPVRNNNNNTLTMEEYQHQGQLNVNIVDQNPDLFWLSSTPNNYFEFPYVQIANAADTNVQVQEGLQFLNILHQDELIDRPEYIHLEQLNTNKNVNHCKRNINKKNDVEDDDDVIFVKEYYLNTKIEKPERRVKRKPLATTEPRRNPKRQVQLQKASMELAMKLSNKEPTNTIQTRRTTNKIQEVNGINQNHLTKQIKKNNTKPVINKETEKIKSNQLNGTKTFKKPNKKKFSAIKKSKKNQREIIDKNFINNLSSTCLTLIEHVKFIKDNNSLTTDKEDDSKKFLDDLKDVLKNTCKLYSVVSGTEDNILNVITNGTDKKNEETV